MVHVIFSFHFQVQGQWLEGHSYRIYGTNDYIMIYGRYSVNIWSKPGNIVGKHHSERQCHLIKVCLKHTHKLLLKHVHAQNNNR